MEHQHYTLHSGGAKGADLVWSQLGKESGLPLKVHHWRPQHYHQLPAPEAYKVDSAVMDAARALGRPEWFKGMDLVRRNFIQAYKAQALYAISTIIPPDGKDKGHVNRSGKEVVAGGTGWTVEMAIQMGKPVYVFDQGFQQWFSWDKDSKVFGMMGFIPTLTPSFAGIGSRSLLSCGVKAIADVYQKTLQYETVNP